jgi:hypothetical protein
VVALSLALLSALVAGCAISNDPEPRRIDTADVPYDLLNPTTAPTATLSTSVPADDTVIYLALEKERKVSPVVRVVPRPVTLDQRLQQLIEARPDALEREAGKSNVITSHTRIREVRQETVAEDRRVIIDLDRFFPGLGSDDVSLAVAQIVYTVDQQYPAAEVEFRVDGQPESIRTAAGTAQDVVSRVDFLEYGQDAGEPGTPSSTPTNPTSDTATSDANDEE